MRMCYGDVYIAAKVEGEVAIEEFGFLHSKYIWMATIGTDGHDCV